MLPYEELAQAIVLNLVKDYEKALNSANRLVYVGKKYGVVDELLALERYYHDIECYKHCEKIMHIVHQIKALEHEMKSEWFYFLCSIDYRKIIKEVQRRCLK